MGDLDAIDIGLSKDQLDTPALLVDADLMEDNLYAIRDLCHAHGVAWRPHMKGIKSPMIARMALRSGAVGVTCAKLGEAEVLTSSGIDNILIANQVVGSIKCARLARLLHRSNVMVLVDSVTNVQLLAQAGRAERVVVSVLIELDIGLNRAGVNGINAALALARVIDEEQGVELVGVAGWEGHTTEIANPRQKERAVLFAVRQLIDAADKLRGEGCNIDIVSCGGSGTFEFTSQYPGVTEVQAGGAILGDVRYTDKYCLPYHQALTMLATVTSRPDESRIICDAGNKSLTSDHTAPIPVGLAEPWTLTFSAEHARIDLGYANEEVHVGDKLEFIVGHAETTVNLHDELVAIRNGSVEAVWPIAARGKYK